MIKGERLTLSMLADVIWNIQELSAEVRNARGKVEVQKQFLELLRSDEKPITPAMIDFATEGIAELAAIEKKLIDACVENIGVLAGCSAAFDAIEKYQASL